MKNAAFLFFSILSHAVFSQTGSITQPSIPDQGVIYEVSVKNSLIDFSTSGDWDFSQITTTAIRLLNLPWCQTLIILIITQMQLM